MSRASARNHETSSGASSLLFVCRHRRYAAAAAWKPVAVVDEHCLEAAAVEEAPSGDWSVDEVALRP
jgi:hypothetical protein